MGTHLFVGLGDETLAQLVDLDHVGDQWRLDFKTAEKDFFCLYVQPKRGTAFWNWELVRKRRPGEEGKTFRKVCSGECSSRMDGVRAGVSSLGSQVLAGQREMV